MKTSRILTLSGFSSDETELMIKRKEEARKKIDEFYGFVRDIKEHRDVFYDFKYLGRSVNGDFRLYPLYIAEIGLYEFPSIVGLMMPIPIFKTAKKKILQAEYDLSGKMRARCIYDNRNLEILDKFHELFESVHATWLLWF